MHKKHQKLLTNILLFLIVALFCLAILEVSVRIIAPQSSIEYIADEHVGWMHEPNIKVRSIGPEFNLRFTTNNHGFIDNEDYTYEKPKDTKRILFLGDSFTEAEHVPFDKAVHQLVEQKLNKQNPQTTYQSLNTGSAGYGTDNEYLLLKHYGVKYNPDIVVLMFFTGNDFRNNYFDRGINQIVFELKETENEDGKKVQEIHIVENNVKQEAWIKRFIGKHSQLAYLLYYKVRPKITEALAKEDQNKKTDTKGPKILRIYDKEPSEDWEKAYELTKALILETKKVTEENNATFVLVTLTNQLQLNPHLLESEVKKEYPNLNTESLDLDKPDNMLKSFCKENNINCLHLIDAFKNKKQQDPNLLLHLPIDGHWNEEGHKLAAEEIFIYLNKNQLINGK